MNAQTHVGQTCRTALILHDGKKGPSATQSISFGQPLNIPDGHESWRSLFCSPAVENDSAGSIFSKNEIDLLVLSRYGERDGLHWIKHARAIGCPVIFHIDDDLLAVPESLGQAKYRHYNHPDRLEALRANIEASDLLYTSTAALAERFTEHGIRAPVLAGDVYCSVAPDEIGALLPSASRPVIGYMGTAGHSADLAMIMPAVCQIMDAMPDVQFELLGSIAMPDGLERYGHRIRKLPPVSDYSEFIPTLRSIGWWIGLAPLEDNPFNRCKADTKWVEYTLAGMAVITSDLPVYKRALRSSCAIGANGSSEWESAIIQLLEEPKLRLDMIAKAQQQLRDVYSHANLRDQLHHVFGKAFEYSRA